MLKRIDLRGSTRDPRDLLPRAQLDVSVAVERIRPVVEAVAEHGFPAIREATERFDGVRLERLRVPVEAIAAAAELLDDDDIRDFYLGRGELATSNRDVKHYKRRKRWL